MAPSSRQLYNRALSSVNDFSVKHFNKSLSIPVSYAFVPLYVAYAHQKGFASSTITSQLSALGYVHQLQGFEDPTKTFMVKKAIQGAGRLAPHYDLRLPITAPIMRHLINALPLVADNDYLASLMGAIFTTAFFALARIGELVPSNSSELSKVVHTQDINFENTSTSKVMWVTFRDFKHNYGKQPHHIPVKQSASSSFCPVLLMQRYLAMRDKNPGPLFISKNGKPFLRSQFDMLTRRVLAFCGFDSSKYKGHSFRIGGATTAASLGYSDNQIQLLGRWKSDAYKRYIRSPQLIT